MKKTFVIVAAFLTMAGVSSWAQVFAFPVKLKGVVAYPLNTSATSRLGVTENSLIGTGNHLVLVVDLVGHTFLLDEVDNNTNLVQTLMSSRRLAVLPDSTFSAGMQFNFTLPAKSGGGQVDGDIDFSGKIKAKDGVPKSISAAVNGVLNDSIRGYQTNGDITIKGKLSSDGAPFDGTPLIPAN
jgi:hypothetical protein